MLCIVRKYDFFPSISDENNTKSRRQRLFSITKLKKKKRKEGEEKKESYQYSRAIKRIAEQRKSSGDRRLERG